MNKISSKFALILLLVVSLLLISANNLLFKGSRIDLTENRMFSIAEGTQNILANLESDVTVKFFYSEEDSSDLGFLRDYARRITDLLGEYVLRSDGRLSLEVLDPEPFSELEDEAAALGIQRISLGFGDEPIFFGLVAIGANGNQEQIEFLHPDREEFLEYDVTKIIHKVSRTESAKIAMISGLQVMGGYDQMQRRSMPPWQTYTQLRQLYEIEILGTDIDDIPDDIALLLLIHPDHVSQQTVYAIDQYALRGGNILAFVDAFAQTDPLLAMGAMAGVQGDLPNTEKHFAPLLANWGVELIADQILADAQHALRVGGGASQRPTPHLGVFGYGRENFVVADHPVLSHLNNIIFSSGSVIRAKADSKTRFEALIQSSTRAGLLDASLLQNLQDPALLANAFTASGERYTVAAHVTGQVSSSFPSGRPERMVPNGEKAADAAVPADVAGESKPMESVIADINSGSEASQAASEAEPTFQPHIAATGDSGLNLFLVADTDVLNDPLWVRVNNFMGQQLPRPFADNGNFFINAAENLIGSQDLMSLRSRGTYARPFHVVESMERDAAERFQDKERELQERLNQTEAKLAQLQQSKQGGDVLTLSDEQQREVDNFRAQQLTIRKELREVRHQLGKDIDRLGGWVKLLNIVVVPLLVTLTAIFLGIRRRRRVSLANRLQVAA